MLKFSAKRLLIRYNLLSINYLLGDRKASINDLLNNKLFLANIKHVSPSLYNDITLRFGSEYYDTNPLYISLNGYLVRSVTRPTPLKLFSGVMFAEKCEDDTELFIQVNQATFNVSLQPERSHQLARDLFESSNFANLDLTLRQDYVIFGKYLKFYDYDIQGQADIPVSLERSEALDDAVLLGGQSDNCLTIVEGMASKYPELTTDEIKGFLAALIDCGLYKVAVKPRLIASFYPNLFGQKSVVELLADKSLAQLPPTDVNFVPVAHSGSARVSLRSLNNVSELVTVMYQVNGQARRKSRASAFHQAYMEKYGVSSVPVMDAFAPDTGIGDSYARPLSADEWGERPVGDPSRLNVLRLFERVLMKVIRSGVGICRLEAEADFVPLGSSDGVPDSFDIMFTIFSKAPGEFGSPGSDLLVLSGVGALSPSGVLAQRYIATEDGHLWPSASDTCESTALNAQLIYEAASPSARAFILNRPHYQYSLDLTNKFRSDLKLDSLVLTFQKSEGLIIYDVDRRQRVIFKVTDALALNHRPTLVRFLYDISQQPQRSAYLPPLTEFHQLDYIPLTTFKNIVIYFESWRVSSEMRNASNRRAFLKALTDWRQVHAIPKWVSLEYGDQKLLLDLDSDLDQELLRKSVNRFTANDACFISRSPYPTHLPAGKDAGGARYAVELLASFERETGHTPIQKSDDFSAALPEPYKEDLNIFSIKLYYIDHRGFDLLSRIKIFLDEVFGDTYEAFFLFYMDPKPHVRLRILNWRNNIRLYNKIYSLIHELMGCGLIYHYEISPYVPEWSRYGGQARYSHVLELFSRDTWIIMQQQDLISEDPKRYAFLSLRPMINAIVDAGIDEIELLQYLAPKASYIKKDVEDFYLQVGRNQLLSLNIGAYRQMDTLVSQHLSAALRNYARSLLAGAVDNKRPSEAICYALVSVIHMHCNRIGLTRPEEDVVYHAYRRRRLADHARGRK